MNRIINLFEIKRLKDWQLKLNILDFAWKFDLMIHPDKDLDGFCRRTIEMGHCVCKDHELSCPCSEALDKVQEQGYCTCRLFLRKDLYGEQLKNSRERLARKDERKKSQGIRRRSL